MNAYDFNIMNIILKEGYTNQRSIAETTNYSLGKVNYSIRTLIDEQYLTEQLSLTEKALMEVRRKTPKNAIILAAGFGMRMFPINEEIPKGLIKIHGEPLIERLICQLHEVEIYEIDVIVGFLKERFEYLIDKYGVNLMFNPDYALKNNIHSLKLVVNKISNTYIIPCDIWSEKNPFSKHELYSWYSVSDAMDNDSSVRINRKMELVSVEEGKAGNTMIGISYILEEEASLIREKIKKFCNMKKYDKSFWEESLFDKDNKMIIYSKVYKAGHVFEINTYEQLRELDEKSENLDSNIISFVSKKMEVSSTDIQDITVLKKGMTNRSFRFSCKGEKYIMRIPGEGTDKLINRSNEYDVYQVLSDKGISDEVIYISPENGYKITKFWDNARVCDPCNPDDVKRCMQSLKNFHETKLKVSHIFDIFRQMQFYESLWENRPSIFVDYNETKQKIMKLKPLIESFPREYTLSHIDSVADNFLFLGNEVRLIDWEYAGMQDPHVDIAMFAIYSMYDRENVDKLIDSYFTDGCSDDIRIKIYSYIAVCGLLWSNWCEYKRFYGIEFGEYSLRQYRYAKEYYNIVNTERKKLNI